MKAAPSASYRRWTQAALARGHSVRFTTLAGALAHLLRCEALPAIERRLRRYTAPDLLILDKLGYVPCDASAADLLFRIISPTRMPSGMTG